MSTSESRSTREAIGAAPCRLYWNGARAAPDGWQGIDRLDAPGVVEDGLPAPAGCASHLYVGPALNQVDQWDIAAVFEEFRRVLAVGGTIRICVYDADAAIAAYHQRDVDFFWDRSSGITEAFTAQLLDFGAARSIFTGDALVSLLEGAGFDDVRRVDAGESRDADAGLAALDVLGDHCAIAEAVNARTWPRASDAEGPSAIHLCPGDRTAERVRAVWSGPPGSTGTLAYREATSPVWSEVGADRRSTPDGSHGRHVFSAQSAVLEPSQAYEYEIRQEVGSSMHVAPGGTFRAPPGGSGATVRLAFLGDTGIHGRADGLADGVDTVLHELVRFDPDVVLGGGDYAYRSSDPRWQTPQQAVHGWLDQMAPLLRGRLFAPQYGNHEVGLGERHRDWAVHFPLPDPHDGDVRSYSFDAGACHVVAFYAPTGDIDPAEVSWLWADLSEARARRGDAWIVVFQHQPLVAHGTSHPADRRVQRAMHALLQVHRVDIHLSAHDQNYERTFPLTWAGGRPIVASAARHRYRRGEGSILAKVSPGGKRSDRGRDFSHLPACRHDTIAVSDDTAHHFSLLDASPERLVLDTYAITAGAPAEMIDRVEVVS